MLVKIYITVNIVCNNFVGKGLCFFGTLKINYGFFLGMHTIFYLAKNIPIIFLFIFNQIYFYQNVI